MRFQSIVEKAGAPTLHMQWVEPEEDPALKKAIRENRVMSVHQSNTGTARDFGTIGYIKDRLSQVLIFPKSLRRFSDRRVVGIKYDLLAKDASTTVKPNERTSSRERPRRKKTSTAAAKAPTKPRRKTTAASPEKREPRAPSQRPLKSRSKQSSKTPEPAPARKPESKPDSPNRVAAAEAVPRDPLEVMREAVDDLKSGNSVAAYERLRAFLDST